MYKHSVYKALILITQIGISIMVPIFLLLIIGNVLKSKFNIDLVLILIIIGLIVGVRNAVYLIKNYLNEDNYNDSESELKEKHKKYVENKQ